MNKVSDQYRMRMMIDGREKYDYVVIGTMRKMLAIHYGQMECLLNNDKINAILEILCIS